MFCFCLFWHLRVDYAALTFTGPWNSRQHLCIFEGLASATKFGTFGRSCVGSSCNRQFKYETRSRFVALGRNEYACDGGSPAKSPKLRRICLKTCAQNLNAICIKRSAGIIAEKLTVIRRSPRNTKGNQKPGVLSFLRLSGTKTEILKTVSFEERLIVLLGV